MYPWISQVAVDHRRKYESSRPVQCPKVNGSIILWIRRRRRRRIHFFFWSFLLGLGWPPSSSSLILSSVSVVGLRELPNSLDWPAKLYNNNICEYLKEKEKQEEVGCTSHTSRRPVRRISWKRRGGGSLLMWCAIMWENLSHREEFSYYSYSWHWLFCLPNCCHFALSTRRRPGNVCPLVSYCCLSTPRWQQSNGPRHRRRRRIVYFLLRCQYLPNVKRNK